ncbi:MAG: hypothetical protein AMS26_04255 [Bacteroides sp. SM23_62]|nr:MAG: hypothetical protein AMS26_04255 [Bacteroides sp. SM23_62]
MLARKDALIKKYQNQENDPYCTMELNVIRLGDVVFATNPFELHTDYGFRITGRSKAAQTFIVQLANGPRDTSQLPWSSVSARSGDR